MQEKAGQLDCRPRQLDFRPKSDLTAWPVDHRGSRSHGHCIELYVIRLTQSFYFVKLHRGVSPSRPIDASLNKAKTEVSPIIRQAWTEKLSNSSGMWKTTGPISWGPRTRSD